jgi:hypothetical protein
VRQEINLLAVPHGKAFSFTSAPAMVCGVVIAAALAAMLGVHENNELHRIETEARAVTESLKAVKARHDVAAARRPQAKPDPALESKVIDLTAQLKARAEIVQALNGGAVGSSSGFSEYLRAFSRGRLEGVWLTAFDIARGGADLTIAGRALSADLVPEYLQRLNSEPPIHGRQFAAVTIRQAKSAREPIKAPADEKETPARATQAPYVEFTLSSGDLGSAPGAENVKPPPPADAAKAVR